MTLASLVFLATDFVLITLSVLFSEEHYHGPVKDSFNNLWVMSFLNLLIAKEKLEQNNFTVSGKCAHNETQVNELTLLKVHLPITHLWHIPQRMFQLHILASCVSFLISRLLSTPNYLNSQFAYVSSHPRSPSFPSTNLFLCVCGEGITQTPYTDC